MSGVGSYKIIEEKAAPESGTRHPTPDTRNLMPPIRIVIADDHALFRDGLRMLLESERGLDVVAEAADGEQAVKLARRHKPDILLLDWAMPRLGGLDVLQDLAALSESVRIVVLTASI